jgi:hypothetical protein
MSEKSASPFTPGLQAVKDDLFKYLQVSCFLVISHDGYWGRGKTVEEAASVCAREGASRTHPASVLLIVGDETAEVNEGGYVVRDAGSYNITVIGRIKLGALLHKAGKGGI